MTTEELVARMEADRQQREAEDKALAEAVAVVMAGTPAGVPLLTFFSPCKQRIAVVLLTEPKYTLYRYMNCGPTGHMTIKPDKLGEELRMEGFEAVADPAAGEALEQWARQPEWEKGLKQTMFIGFWNTFSFHGRHDLCRQIDRAGSLGEALHLGARLLREELPGEVWH
ncbi:MAG: hypothetical protein KJ077_11105 [Anaerolineae bacterium]|nr:hypothetical protein [Anaerolineae bacterium]